MPVKFKGLKAQLLFIILEFGIRINFYDFDLFLDYLKSPKSVSSFSNGKHVEKFNEIKRENINFLVQEFYDSYKKPYGEEQLIQIYLENYFLKNNSYGVFSEFLKTKYLSELLNKINLYKGNINKKKFYISKLILFFKVKKF